MTGAIPVVVLMTSPCAGYPIAGARRASFLALRERSCRGTWEGEDHALAGPVMSQTGYRPKEFA